MAEKETERKVTVYRSVSFKKLESWNVNPSSSGAKNQHHKSEDLKSSALPPPAVDTAAEKAQPSATRSVTVSRKVSKISAASLPTAALKKGTSHTISPSVRQLSEKFSASPGLTHGSSSVGLGVARSKTLSRNKEDPSLPDSGYLPGPGIDFSDSVTDQVKDHKYHSAYESVSGSDSDRSQRRRTRKSLDGTSTGKRDYTSTYCASINNNTLNTDDDVFVLGASPSKIHRAHQSSHGECIHVDSNWPSVTKIRELFGDGHRKKHRSTSDADDLKSAGFYLHCSSNTKDNSCLSDRSDRQSPLQSRGTWHDSNSSDHDTSTECLSQKDNRYQGMDTEKHSYGVDINSSTSCLRGEQLTDICRVQSPCGSGKAAEYRTQKLDSDPQRSPPVPPRRSSSAALPLRSHSFTHHPQPQEHRPRAEQPQSPDSLHSSHSSKPQTGPALTSTRWRLSSGEEEEELGGQRDRNTHPLISSSGGISSHFSRNKYGSWAKPLGKSSGSEEDSPAALAQHNRDNLRRRSLRKKKKSSCNRDDGESDDSDDRLMIMERFPQSCDPQQGGRRLEGPKSRASFGGSPWERGLSSHGSTTAQESYKLLYKGPSEGPGSSPVPLVSRISKVNIPSFLSSPGGSRSSSRYSSTETLKEEDQPSATSASGTASTLGTASTSMLSKTYYGNFTMYRSPSFGHGDNFSRAPVRVRPKLVPSLSPGESVVATPENRVYHHSLSSEKDRNRMSMSNPDIASETLSLLSSLKTDLSELRVRKKKHEGEDALNSGLQGAQGMPSVYRMGSRKQGLHPGRPSLKDLTATLRRAKSFSYSEKPLRRQYPISGPAKRSSSEQRLDCQGDGDGVVVSDREVESDDCRMSYDYDEIMPTPLQDRYIQEARQVIRDICQMGAGEDDNEDEGFKRKENDVKEDGQSQKEETKLAERVDEENEITVGTEGEDSEHNLQKRNSEENMFYDKSVDELSGHESSLTDEGIVTEPEGGSCVRDLLGQPLAAWNQSDLYEETADLTPERPVSATVPAVRMEYDGVAIGGDTCSDKTVNQGPLEAPSTPCAIRRRRKFSSAGNNGSDSSNGSNGESNGESAYRSLSDPMPHRCRSVAEDSSKSFSVDSNLLGSLSLSSKVSGGAESSVADLSECTGSAASDLSVCSDSLRDYSTVIQSIVHEPGAMDNLTDEKANGKIVKKKSFSDPSRRGELAATSLDVQTHPSEPISESEQPIPPSSSEPILSEQRELWEVDSEQHEPYHSGGRRRSQSERALRSHPSSNGVPKTDTEEPCLSFDPKLTQVLSPRMGRRSSKKRSIRLTQQHSCDDTEHLEESFEEQEVERGPDDHLNPAFTLPQLPPSKTRPKHVRHTSEPATFIPITPPDFCTSQEKWGLSISIPEPSRPSKPGQGHEAPALEHDPKQYVLALNPPESAADSSAAVGGAALATLTSEPKLPTKTTEELNPAPLKAKPRVDMRRHVMMTLLDTEQSYVESLRTLIQGYMRPLKQPENSPLCDPSLVDEMFYQIPEILEHHEHFLEQISSCVSDWHDQQTVGHLLIESFSKEVLANIYSAYIDNFLNAKDAVRIAKEAKPAFLKFLEQSMRENKEKQALADLMIKPVQRIPRYELLVKDLLKHTPEDHPDHSLLLEAQKDIKRLAERINKGRRSAEEVERETRILQEIEAHIEGVEHILNPQRKFLRQEMVMESKTVGGKKDRSLFLFSDLLICTTLKRKSGSLRRSSMSLYSAASVIDTTSKYKFLWKLPLEEVEMVKGSNPATNRENIQKTITRLDEDLSTLGQISKLSETLSFPHQSLDDVIKDLMASVHRELAEKQSLAFSMTFLPTKVELTTASAESTFIFEFSSPDARSNFEQAFEEAKKKLAMNKDQWNPEFLKAIPIMKTRSGMQFSCASPSHSCPENTYEVWVCNSDGYVGQVCLLNIRHEPTVEACIAVCSARIICIAAVPGLKGRERGEPAVNTTTAPTAPAPELTPTPSSQHQQQLHISISGSSLELSDSPASGPTSRELVPFDSDDTDDEDSPSPSSTLQSQASHSTISSSFGNDEGTGSKDMATETTSSEEEQEFPVSGSFSGPRLSSNSPVDGRAMRRSSRGSFTRASLDDLLSIDPEAYQSSVWLGTEDGCIHVYQSSDNIRNRKNSMKMQHSASILCILYLDNKVFVSLANGEVIVYQREAGSFWDPQSSQTLCLGSPSGPVSKMVPVAGKLWCGCQNRVLIINTSTLVQEHSFAVGQDSGRSVSCMVGYGQGVWVALQGSAQVRLYHAATYESLTEVDVAPAVHKMLAGSDAIIRQHKAACLRITALLACKDLLWIGTSAGVVLTLAIPPVSSSTVPGSLRAPLLPMGSAHGHTGHVRFLTSIELPEGFDVTFPPQTESGNPTQSGTESHSGGLQRRDSTRRCASTLLPTKSNLLVISGGDGYEDFRLTNSSETVGRDDSTNHLLLWKV
ncbi:rho guanine nucleotide exchange factor 17 [Chanos chanos]|uniref:Rho guanine nucleotide exchange factor 17 n=1 Tax=Chanos chanos TaxID=29144 RepID=A0A6J2UQ24_CHACN|nr:rho guanine nucleotide exchange factor 17 [Chanos chanos]